ncbi:MAG: LegC family aminotransferase [Oscillospiraceae bacterium]|nr:LegC family aminotransferase [Oscillospiraceae bacterium]
MSEKFIPLSVPNLHGKELEYLTEAVETEWVSTGGPYITQFEKNVAAFVGASEAVACQSGTAGLHLALLESGIERGDIVITPDLTFIATTNPIHYCGGEPVFMDCDDTLCIDPAKVRRYCEQECHEENGALYDNASGRRVRALMATHIFGNLCDMERLVDIAEEFHLFLIEDAAEALGSFWNEGRYAGKHAGTVGEIGIFSFNGNKIMTTGGGGMIIARDKTKLEHMRYLSTQSKNDTLRFVHDEVGYNYRLTNVQAALGIAQFEQMPQFLATKKRNWQAYNDNGVPLLPFRSDISPNYWFYSYVSDDRRDELIAGLAKRNIQSRPVWELMHRLKPYADCRAFEIERAAYYHQNIVNLPCSTNLTGEDVKIVCAAVKEILR